MPKPTIFIGSAQESLALVDALEESLRDSAQVQRWDFDSFQPGDFALDSLLEAGARFDFAAFVLGREDVTTSRNSTEHSPRDNIVFEVGLFIAAMGKQRVFPLVDSEGVRIPSDWAGLSLLRYHRGESRPRDVVFNAAKKMRLRIEQLGPRAKAPSSGFIGDEQARSICALHQNSSVALICEVMEAFLFETETNASAFDKEAFFLQVSNALAESRRLCATFSHERVGNLLQFFESRVSQVEVRAAAEMGAQVLSDPSLDSNTKRKRVLAILRHAHSEAANRLFHEFTGETAHR